MYVTTRMTFLVTSSDNESTHETDAQKQQSTLNVVFYISCRCIVYFVSTPTLSLRVTTLRRFGRILPRVACLFIFLLLFIKSLSPSTTKSFLCLQTNKKEEKLRKAPWFLLQER